MNAHKCCTTSLRAGRWVLPTAILVFMPKCPACFAGYIALATGLGIPFTTATWLRTSLIIICIATLAWLTFRLVRNRIHRHHLNPNH